MHGPCRGVTITGARWPLSDADLEPVVGSGVSNEALGAGDVHVELAAGVLTVIVQPDSTPDGDSTASPTHADTPTNRSEVTR